LIFLPTLTRLGVFHREKRQRVIVLRTEDPDAVDYLDKILERVCETPEVEIPTWRAISATAMQ
jgi:hypothetical protein